MIVVLAASLQAQWSNDPNNNLIIGVGWDPHIVSDSAGGFYISYNYGSFYPQKLAVERLDMFGYKPWGDKKQILGELPEQWQAEIVEDGEGGVIISYQDNEVIGTDYITRVRVQRVDSNGNFLWGQTGVRVSLSETNQGGQKIISDGVGGCIIVWGDTLAQIRINRINSLGERLWGDSGKVIETNPIGYTIHLSKMRSGHFAFCYSRILFGFNNIGEVNYRDSLPYRILNITSDELGGVAASWKGGSSNNIKIHSQRKDSLGNNLWQEPYVEIADSLDINTHLEIKYNNGFIYYSWSGKKNGIDKVAQFQALRIDGTILYSDGSIQIGKPPLGGAYIVQLEENRTSFIYHENNYLPDSLLAQTYDTLGYKLWDTSGVLISHPSIEYSSFTTDGNGGFIIGGVINNFTVVAQQVSSYGKLGEIITSVLQEDQEVFPTEYLLEQNFPNPFNSSSIIKYQIPKVETHRDASPQLVKLIVYDVLGNEVATLVNEEKPAGEYGIEFTATGLSSGIYFYKLEAGNPATGSGQSFIQTKKMILLK